VVGPFLGYDCFGRELVSCCERRVAFPPVRGMRAASDEAPAQGPWLLLARPARDQDRDRNRAPGDLLCPPAPCAPGDVELCWAVESRVASSDGLPLARLDLVPDGFRLDTGFRPARATPFRSTVAAGATPPGATNWVLVGRDNPLLRVLPCAMLDTRIDTSGSAGGCGTCCVAWLQGPRKDDRGLWVLADRVVRADCGSIMFRVWVCARRGRGDKAPRSAGALDAAARFREFAREQRLHVSWMCVEPAPEVPPVCGRADGLADGLAGRRAPELAAGRFSAGRRT
jgi:hypothetical protein